MNSDQFENDLATALHVGFDSYSGIFIMIFFDRYFALVLLIFVAALLHKIVRTSLYMHSLFLELKHLEFIVCQLLD